MARSRNIKPGFFKNEDLADCDPLARILFAGLWTIADREGRLEDRPKRIKAEILPYDNVDGDALLSQLVERGFIVRYCVDGHPYLSIPTFIKNQQPHINEAQSTIPAPPDTLLDKEEYPTSTVQAPEQYSANSPLTLNPSSLNSESLSGESADADAPPPTPILSRGKPQPKPPRKTLAGHPIAADFVLTEGMRQKAKERGWLNFIDIDKHTKRFIDYWTVGEGQGKCKKNWMLTWEVWMDDEATKAETRGIKPNGSYQQNKQSGAIQTSTSGPSQSRAGLGKLPLAAVPPPAKAG